MADWFETRFRELDGEGVDPAFAARLRALVIDEWEADPTAAQQGAGEDTDTVHEAGEIIVLTTEDRPAADDPGPLRRRMPGRWLLVAAAVALLALVGALVVDDGQDDEVDTAASVPGVGPAQEGPAREVPDGEEFVLLEPGRWYVDPDGDDSTPLRVSFDVAGPGWNSWLGTVDFSGSSHVVLTATTISNIVRHGCTDHAPADPPVGPTVDDLATALTQLQPFEVTAGPTDVTVLGYEGTHLQLTVPDLPVGLEHGESRFPGCAGGQLAIWFSPIHDGGANPFVGYNGEPGRTEDFWILDVDGTRLVLSTTWGPGSQPQDVAELDAIVDSIRIEP